ncbi:MAG: Na+/H+ antiporter NhaA [Gemmatimonas sp.]|nr:Na+/H+ antiporter NhaA [Gemmatimonas sp.]MCA2985922.1 Na+/H+ antiporter NhaA [Gemmatimonas sp.]MCA2989716.1 Na+/H+ antiporter NhaA [Gemmatimonas sp.]MCA2993603.1 Na+/H+ antiporter NhaA [Gemmatimonas sp.]
MHDAAEDVIEEGYVSEKAPPPSQALSGLLLLLCAAVALVWANSSAQASYHGLLHAEVAGWSALHFINDGLMAVFFLLVGLEIKHELQDGALSSVRKAALPVVGAAGGMLLPAAIYALVAMGTPAARGWGIPMATDIAFALGIVALLGNRVPAALRIFLAALAIADDIGAVLVIAVFYTPSVATLALAAIVIIMLVLFWLNKRQVHAVWPYLLGGLLLWIAVYKSGVHASIAGVLLAFTIPSRGEHSVQHRIEQVLARPVNFGIVPIFALANAGVTLPSDVAAFATQPAVTATMLGLLIGKPLGIFGAAWIAVKARWADLPADCTWGGLFGVAILGGIGFTMALFIAGLAFGESPQLDAAKIGVLSGSLLTGILGAAVLMRQARRSAAAVVSAVG